MQKSIVMTMTIAMAMFATYDHHMARATVRDASFTSSANEPKGVGQYGAVLGSEHLERDGENSHICTIVSEPNMDQMIDTWVSRHAIP